jgi:glycosyltransferase involved in cell wall biosynthesis
MKLTVLVLSCRRLAYLQRTLEAARRHFRETETDVDVTWVCFDNGSSDEDRCALLGHGFDLLHLSRTNLGQGPALNHLVSSVRTEYFMLLEDDWVLENPAKVRFVRETMAILDSDRRLGQLKLDSLHDKDFTDRALYDGPFRAWAASVSHYIQNPESQWGGFCCPPAITRTSSVRTVGSFLEDQPFRRWWAESEYCRRFARQFYAAKSPEMLIFKQIVDEPSPGWGAEERDIDHSEAQAHS